MLLPDTRLQHTICSRTGTRSPPYDLCSTFKKILDVPNKNISAEWVHNMSATKIWPLNLTLCQRASENLKYIWCDYHQLGREPGEWLVLNERVRHNVGLCPGGLHLDVKRDRMVEKDVQGRMQPPITRSAKRWDAYGICYQLVFAMEMICASY